MTTYIRINPKTSYPDSFAVTEESLKYLFPSHNFSSGPPVGYTVLVQVEPPQLGPYEKFNDSMTPAGLEYKLMGDLTVKEVWHVVLMNDEEKKAKQDKIKEDWAKTDWDSWTFDEASCNMQPPVPFPSDGAGYEWDESTTSWKKVSDVAV
jgi:hypothetical protein